MMQPSRSLLAFAVIADSFSASGDIVQGLMPLFEPLVNDFCGERFDARKFASELKSRYDFEIPLAVAEDWAKRLETAGYLENIATVPGIADYRYRSLEGGTSELVTDQFDGVLDAFKTFAANNAAGISFNEDVDFSREFYNRLTRIENLVRLHNDDTSKQENPRKSVSSTLRLHKTTDSHEVPNLVVKAALHLDFLFARFIEELSARNDGSLELLARISAGAMLAEVVLSFQEPPKQGSKLTEVDFYFDAPLIMDLLGLEPQREKYAKELFQALKSVDAKLWIFDHSVEEIDHAIHARMTEAPDGRQHAWRTREKILLAKLKGRVAQELSNLGIQVMRFQGDAYQRSLAYFNENQEDLLFSAFNFHNNNSEAARSADARSIANVERLRRARRIPIGAPLLSAGPVFVTRNAILETTSRRVMNRIMNEGKASVSHGRISADLCIMDRYLAGLLWLTAGGSAKQLPYAQLVANCAMAITPRNSVIKKAINLLSSINQEEALMFEAIMQDDRAEHYLMDLTLNDVTLVDDNNIREIYEKVRQSVGRETEERLYGEFQEQLTEQERQYKQTLAGVQERMTAQEQQHASQIEALKEEYEGSNNRNDGILAKLEAQIFETNTTVFRQQQESKTIAQANADLKSALKQEAEYKYRMLASSLSIAQKIGRAVPIVIGLTLALSFFQLQDILGSLTGSWKSVGQGGISLVIIVSFAIAFWDTPEIIFGAIRRRLVQKSYSWIVRMRGLEDFASSCPVDWKTFGILSPKNLAEITNGN